MRRYQLKCRPKAYPITEQQKNFMSALRFCQVKKGMKKSELQDAMRHCIPQYFKDLKEQEKAVAIEEAALENAEGPKEQEHVGEREKEEDYALQPRGL